MMLHKQKTYNRIARLYDILDLPFEHGRYKHLRRGLFDGLKGTLLDAGVGKLTSPTHQVVQYSQVECNGSAVPSFVRSLAWLDRACYAFRTGAP